MSTPADLAYGSPWRYLIVPNGLVDPTFVAADYDDSGWSTGSLPVGESMPADDGIAGTDDWLPIAISISLASSIYLRTTVPAVPGPYAMATLRLRRDCDYFVWVNGVNVANGSTPGATFPAALFEVTHTLPAVTGVMAVYAQHKIRGGPDGWYLDMALECQVIAQEAPVVRLWPRDSLGLAAAPRQFPPPRSNRLIGGHP